MAGPSDHGVAGRAGLETGAGARDIEPDPFTTPLNRNANAEEVKRYRISLLASTEKEKAARTMFQLELAATQG